jgi:hypothetical protein
MSQVKITPTVGRNGSAIWVFALLCLTAVAGVSAETTVPINESVTFPVAENGQAACRQGSTGVTCSNFLGETAARPSTREVETSARIGNLQSVGFIGIPIYSTASVYNDFFIPGPPDGNMIDVQITVQYDFTGNIAGAGIYAMSNSLALRVQDRTANALVARQEFISMERQGDQGVTDVSGAQERRVLTGEVGHMLVKLRRGHHYRLHFELESSASTFVAGTMRADAFAKWNRLSVNVGEDEVELLSIHDQQVKAALLGVQSTILGALAKHDTDIKAELAIIKNQLSGIEGDLDEIKTLLLTPQGRREGFPILPNNPNSNSTSTSAPTATSKSKPKK